jgi:osmotically-inducible protein OsmY
MNPRTPFALTALLTAALAFAQASATDLTPTTEPVASAFKPDGPDGELATSVAQDLIAEPSLQGSKIAVSAENGALVTLTGVTVKRAQMQRAVEIASARVGEGKVINAIQSEEVYVAGNRPADEQAN